MWIFFLKMQKKTTKHCIMYNKTEDMTTTIAQRRAIWLKHLLADMKFVQEEATSIMRDNLGYIALTKNPKYFLCTRHIDAQHHFIQEKLDKTKNMLKLLFNRRHDSRRSYKKYFQMIGIKIK